MNAMRLAIAVLCALLLTATSATAQKPARTDYHRARVEISTVASLQPSGSHGACLSYRIRELGPHGLWLDLGLAGQTWRTKEGRQHDLKPMVGLSGSTGSRARIGFGLLSDDLTIYARIAIIR